MGYCEHLFRISRKPRKKKRTYAMSCLVRSRSAVRRAPRPLLVPRQHLGLEHLRRAVPPHKRAARPRRWHRCCCWLGGRAPLPCLVAFAFAARAAAALLPKAEAAACDRVCLRIHANQATQEKREKRASLGY